MEKCRLGRVKEVGLRCSGESVHKGEDAVRRWQAPMLSLSASAITGSPLSSISVATSSGQLKINCWSFQDKCTEMYTSSIVYFNSK